MGEEKGVPGDLALCCSAHRTRVMMNALRGRPGLRALHMLYTHTLRILQSGMLRSRHSPLVPNCCSRTFSLPCRQRGCTTGRGDDMEVALAWHCWPHIAGPHTHPLWHRGAPTQLCGASEASVACRSLVCRVQVASRASCVSRAGG